MITRYLALGLPVLRDGKIPLAAGRAWVRKQMNPALSGNHKTRSRSTKQSDFLDARADRERTRARVEALKLQQLLGKLIPKGEVAVAQEARAAAERDALMGLPARVSGEMASRLGIEEGVLHAELDRVIRPHLAGRSGRQPAEG